MSRSPLIAFVFAFLAWIAADDKDGIRVSPRQFVMMLLMVYCGLTTYTADFPVEAAEKWGWVWKAMIFAIFLPFTLRTKLRIEALALIMVLSVGVIVIGGGIKTLASGGGGYGELKLLVNDNTGLYEGSIISAVAICVIPLALWLARHGTIFKPGWMVTLFAWGICFACILMPIGTQARTGLICVGVLGVMMLRSVKRRLTYLSLVTIAGLLAAPLLPQSFTEPDEHDRQSPVRSIRLDPARSVEMDHRIRQVASVRRRLDAFRQNEVSYYTVKTDLAGNNNAKLETERIVEKARAYHSSYFEMLGEQGYPGLSLWLLLHLMGVLQMEILRRRYARNPPRVSRGSPRLADALQQAQIVYLIGGAFVGIAFQPFCYMLVGLQCGLSAYMGRIRRAAPVPFRAARKAPAPLAAAT